MYESFCPPFSSGHAECSFDKLAANFYLKVRKFSPQNPKNHYCNNIRFIFLELYILNVPPQTYNAFLANLPKTVCPNSQIILLKARKFFLNFSQNSLKIFPWTRTRNGYQESKIKAQNNYCISCQNKVLQLVRIRKFFDLKFFEI